MNARTALGFDYGRKRIGVATGQELTATTQPLATVNVSHDQPDWDHISRLIQEWRPDILIVGLPMHMNGTEHEISDRARRFARQLEGRYQLPVEMVDERLTSLEAEDILAEQRRTGHIRRRTAKHTVDQVAAELILKTWLGT